MSKNKYECTWNKGNKEEKYGLTYEKLKSQYSVITNKGLKRQKAIIILSTRKVRSQLNWKDRQETTENHNFLE